MELKEFNEKMVTLSKDIEIELNEKQIEQFYNYMQLLIEWNEKINLTAITEPDEIVLKHFIDSLTISRNIKKEAKIIDVGTGAGFPGIPLKIIRDDIDIVLLDSLNKRINFLNMVIETLGLKKIKTIHGRVEDFGRNKIYREEFDVATSRAVANMSILSEYMIPLIKIGGKALCMKGTDLDEEIENSKKAINLLGGKIEEVEKFNLPQSDIKRCVVIIEKLNKTDKRFPRKAGTPSKEPLK